MLVVVELPREKVGNIKIYYESYGEGPVIIALHGFTGSHVSWMFQAPFLSEKYRFIAIDQRGHGRSSKPDGECAIITLSEDLNGFMERLDIEKAVILGQSLGSLVAQQFAVDHPDKTRALILSGTFAWFDEETQKGYDEWIRILEKPDGPEKWFYTSFFENYAAFYSEKPLFNFNEEFFRSKAGFLMFSAWLNDLKNSNANTLIQIVKALKKFDLRKRLPEIAAPTLVIAGEFEMVPFQEEVHQLILGSKFVVIKNAGHGSRMDNPVLFNAAILSFLDEVEKNGD